MQQAASGAKQVGLGDFDRITGGFGDQKLISSEVAAPKYSLRPTVSCVSTFNFRMIRRSSTFSS